MSISDISNAIKLKSISELKGLYFFIPNYQRGYRWSEREVTDLLNDIKEFYEEINHKNESQIYCLQPLVVKLESRKNDEILLEEIRKAKEVVEVERLLKKTVLWRVVDGQQRLTTIYLILSYLQEENLYSLEYETRNDSWNFIKNIGNENFKESNSWMDNIDFFYIYKAYETICNWFGNNDIKQQKEKFKETLLNRVNIIWYETSEDEIDVFTRLNIGKIPLTNSELIKALFLNSKNFVAKNDDEQTKIGLQRDNMEYELHNDELWNFIYNNKNDKTLKYNRSTRIDFLFDIYLKLEKQSVSDDQYSSFVAIRKKIKNNEDWRQIWIKIIDIFQIIKEWFNDIYLYHYIGYLVEVNNNSSLIAKLIEYWKEVDNREEFIGMPDKPKSLKGRIYTTIKNDLNFEYKYDEDKNKPKRNCKPVLLLHNVETVIQQNETFESQEKYKMPNFSKFPFHLYRKDGWDVEHIYPSNNEPPSLNVQKEFLDLYEYYFANIDKNDELKDRITEYIKSKDSLDKEERFNQLYEAIIEKTNVESMEKEKNTIKNFALLDSSTNRSISNLMFYFKRLLIINRDNLLDDEKVNKIINNSKTQKETAFIPPCTRNIFMKFYNPNPKDLTHRGITDAICYENDIKEKLHEYINEYEKNRDKEGKT